MSFSFYSCEWRKFMLTGITTQFKPLCAVFQKSHRLCQQSKSHLTPHGGYWAVQTRGTWTAVAPLKMVSTSIAVWVQVLALPALQVNWVTCSTHFCLFSLRLLSFIDKLVPFCLQIHGTLVTSSDRFCWKVFFPLEWQERNAGTLLVSPTGISWWIWTQAKNQTLKPYTIDCFKAVGIYIRFTFNLQSVNCYWKTVN